ncbi:MAG: molybdenum cofactor guanylyltransferase MobA [Arenicellales bacterium]
MKADNITAVILAGGRATRMGGQDKGLLEVAGKSIVARIASQLSEQVSKILINANRNQDEYEKLGYPVINDSLSNYQGPLAGMAAALAKIDTEWLLTVPCDGPFVAKDYAVRMMQVAEEQSVKLVVASDADRIQPVYALIHIQLLPSMQAFLKSGERKIDRWYAQHPYSIVEFRDREQMFTNINTPEQLAATEDSLKKHNSNRV